MQPMFESLLKLMREPHRPERGVQTDSSILLVYPPEKELDFREQLVDVCFPALEGAGLSVSHRWTLLDSSSRASVKMPFEALQEEEFDDYEWMLYGLSQRVETSLRTRLQALVTQQPWRQLYRLQHCRALPPWFASARFFAACAIFTLELPWHSPAMNVAASSNS